MNRRQYLAATVAVVPITGCTSDDGDSGSIGDSSSSENVKLLESAQDELETAIDTFESELDSIDGTDSRISFQGETIQAHLDQAESYLDDAEEETVEQNDWIEAMRDVISFMRSFIMAFESFSDGFDELQTGATYLQNERFIDAESTFIEANDYINQSDDELVLAREYLSEINFNEFSDTSEVDRIEIETYLEEFIALNTDLEYLTRTYRDLARGLADFMQAAESFDNEQYNDAQDEFGNARNHFSSAASTIREGEESATDVYIDTFIGLTCYTEAARDAADSFLSASSAASYSNWATAESHTKDASTALDRCDYQAT